MCIAGCGFHALLSSSDKILGKHFIQIVKKIRYCIVLTNFRLNQKIIGT